MTKRQVLDWYFSKELKQSRKELQDQLYQLVEENRITSGCLLVYGLYNQHDAEWIGEQLNKAGKSKNYFRSLKRESQWTWNYHYTRYLEHMETTKSFITEQQSLPFEQTQKQVLIATGQLKED